MMPWKQNCNNLNYISSTELLKYYSDPFLAEFIKKKQKFFPIINRGTWSRVYAVNKTTMRFVNFIKEYNETKKSNIPIQIICIGAGYDTTFFNLKYKRFVINFN